MSDSVSFSFFVARDSTAYLFLSLHAFIELMASPNTSLIKLNNEKKIVLRFTGSVRNFFFCFLNHTLNTYICGVK